MPNEKKDDAGITALEFSPNLNWLGFSFIKIYRIFTSFHLSSRIYPTKLKEL